MADDPRIRTVNDVFAAWSSGDADAPEESLHLDAVLDDVEGGGTVRVEGDHHTRTQVAKSLGR